MKYFDADVETLIPMDSRRRVIIEKKKNNCREGGTRLETNYIVFKSVSNL